MPVNAIDAWPRSVTRGLAHVLLAAALSVVVMPLRATAEANDPPATRPATQVFYVDAPAGNDANQGTSADEPWRSLDKVNATTFAPDSRILFKADGIWVGQLRPKGSRTASAPITIDKYGVGSKPVIDGNGAAGPEGGAVVLSNQNYWEISNLAVTNDADTNAQRYGVLIRWSEYGTGHHVYLRSLDIYDVKGNLGGRFEGDGIMVIAAGATTATNFDDVRIENNTIRNIDRTGISIWSQWAQRGDVKYGGSSYHATTGPWRANTNVVIRNNALDTLAGDGILVSVTDGALVERNVVKAANSKDSITGANAGIWPHNSDNALVQFNEAYLTKGTHDSMGYDIDLMNHDAIVQYNYSHDNNGGFIVVCSNTIANATTNSKIRYNISQNDRSYVFSQVGNIRNTQIYNNTIFTSSNLIGTWSWNGLPDKTSYQNNIFYNMNNGAYNLSVSTNNVFDSNVYFGTHPATEPVDSNKITADPKLVAPNTGGIGRNTVAGYKLQPGSPAIDSGVTVTNNGRRDYFNNPVPTNGTTDRGAHEYANDTSVVTPTPLVDQLNDWSKASDRSAGLVFATNSPDIFGDASRAIRSASALAEDQYITSNYTGVRHIEVTAYYDTADAAAADPKVLTSNNYRTWVQQLVIKTSETPVGGTWVKRIYKVDLLAPGALQAKVIIPANVARNDNPQLGTIALSATGNDHAAFIDDLNDWSKIYTRSTGITFDTSAQAFGDNSRVFRTTTAGPDAQNLVYRYAGDEVSSITATAYFRTGVASDNITFSSSSDGSTWTALSTSNVADTIVDGWTTRRYEVAAVPSGTHFVRVEFPLGGERTWNPNLGQVTLNM